jgi:hypothetical protein
MQLWAVPKSLIIRQQDDARSMEYSSCMLGTGNKAVSGCILESGYSSTCVGGV